MNLKSLPETSPSPWVFSRVSLKAGGPIGAAQALAIFLHDNFHGQTWPVWLFGGLLGFILLLGAVGTYYWCQWIAALDELQRLIQLKAFAVAIPAYVGIAMSGELLLQAGLPGFRLDGLWALPMFMGLQFAFFLWFWWRNR